MLGIVRRRRGTYCKGVESFLARRVPDLRLDRLGVDLDAARRELDADGRLGVEVELVARESRENYWQEEMTPQSATSSWQGDKGPERGRPVSDIAQSFTGA